MDLPFKTMIIGYALKQIIAFFLYCLLFSLPCYARSVFSLAETTMPGAVAIPEYANNNESKPDSAAPSSSDSSHYQPAPALTITETSPYINYHLAPGDALSIAVWKEEGLQEQQFLISPDGTIIYPLVGTVIAAGKTITELKEHLVLRLADYISEPTITIKIINNQGNSVFVIGKVNKPGQYYSGRRLDVMQALSMAGGLTVYASQGSISILRRVGNEIKVFPFDYGDVIDGDHVEQNILLEPGDTITVP